MKLKKIELEKQIKKTLLQWIVFCEVMHNRNIIL
jgi:hypothetical protein